MRLLEVNYSILQKPNLTQVEEYKACAIVLQYLDSSLECYSTEKSPEFVKLMCKCIIAILSHKEFKILESFPDFLKAIPEDMRSIFGENLCKFLTDIFNDLKQQKVSSKKYPRKEIQKVLTAFERVSQADDKKMFVIPAGRSARIAHLAKNSPKSPKKQVASPIALRLFGKDPETLSPLKVRGSQLNNNPSSKKKKAANVIDARSIFSTPILEENTCDFVAIDTEVRFLPEKLNEHQKEVMKKRREDIPALYEDLTQSLSNSQDLFSVKFNTNLCESEKMGSEHIEPLAVEDDETINTMRKGQFSSNSENKHKSEDLFSSSSNLYSKETKLLEQELDGASVSPIFQNIIMERANEDLKDHKSSDWFDTSEDDGANKNSLAEEQRKRKMEKELLRLKMDVVGADDFVSVVRRTRPKENKEQTTKPKIRKSMLSGDKSPAKDDHSRRKSIGVIEEIKDKNNEEHNEALRVNKIVDSKKETIEEFTIVTNAKAKENDLVTKSDKSKGHVDSIGKQVSKKIIKNVGEPDKKKLKGTKNPGRTTETDDIHSPIAETPKSTRKHSVKLEEHQPVGVDEKQKAKESKSQDSEMKIKTKMREKRKNVGWESEDIIESSQESFSDVTPLLNSAKKRKTSIFEEKAFEGPNTTTKTNILCCKMNPENLGNHNDNQSLIVVINEPSISENIEKSVPEPIENGEQVAADTTQDTTISRDTSLDTTQTQDSLQDISLSSSKISKKAIIAQQQDTLTQDTLTQVTQETPTQVELDMLSEANNPTVLYLDLPKKPELTESEEIMCRMDTMSICTDLDVSRSSDQATHHQSLEEVELQARSPTKSENKDALFGELVKIFFLYFHYQQSFCILEF